MLHTLYYSVNFHRFSALGTSLGIMPSKLQTIHLLGKPYKVRCPEGKEQELADSVSCLRKKLQETQNHSGLSAREDIILMTALNMCHKDLQNNQ
jgi:cell division protein ZapA (FtsZ GTPase activity inhibitor)